MLMRSLNLLGLPDDVEAGDKVPEGVGAGDVNIEWKDRERRKKR